MVEISMKWLAKRVDKFLRFRKFQKNINSKSNNLQNGGEGRVAEGCKIEIKKYEVCKKL